MSRAMITRLAVAAAVTVSTALVTGPAVADPANSQAVPQLVSITANPDGLVTHDPLRVRPGAVTFRMSTPDDDQREIAVIRINRDVDVESYLDTMTTVMFTKDKAAKIAAGRVVYRDSTLLGGVAVRARAVQSTTHLLLPGERYLLVDLISLGGENPARNWAEVTVAGPWRAAAVPVPDHVVLEYEQVADQPRFAAPTQIAQHSKLLVVNTTAEIHNADFQPVRPGTTDADLDLAFKGLGPWPFTGTKSEGGLGMSGGQWALIDLDLAPGRYVLISWIGDPDTTVPGAMRGMHQIIDVV
jgi:hypothetical protein